MLGAAYGAVGVAASRLLCVPQEGWEPAHHKQQSSSAEAAEVAKEADSAAAFSATAAATADKPAEGGDSPDAPRALRTGEGLPADLATRTRQFPLLWMTVFGYATGGLALITSAKMLVSDIFGG